ncbi:MAG: DNA/RNA nuclease SfsA [Thermodesulfobacteriota bacterium]
MSDRFAPVPRGLGFPPLIMGTLRRRYKRFLADVALEDGSVVTAHCPNSGRMTGCSEPGRRVYLSRDARPGRKLAYTWQMIVMENGLVGVNTQVPNILVRRAVLSGCVPELSGFAEAESEVRVGEKSRLDLRFSGPGAAPVLVEVKNCTLVEDGKALFPDAVTARGARHLAELTALSRRGLPCAVFFLVQRMDAESFGPADRVDPDFGRALRKAARAGVAVIAYDCLLDPTSVRLRNKLPVNL